MDAPLINSIPKTFDLGGLAIDPVAYGISGNAILGIKESGKSYAATLMAEHLFEAGIPFTTFDAIGVWSNLRVPGVGRGYPVVVAGGMKGDLPLTPANAAEIMLAAMKGKISVIFDLYSMHLSKADWKRIVMAATEVMLYQNNEYGMRHVFLEEAAEYIPQRVGPDTGQVYAAVEKLARMGGNARLGYTLINPRAEDVNKSVLELCDNLFLFRQKGRHSITALSKWMDVGNVTNRKAVAETLSTLPQGQCWAWMAKSETPALIKVPAKNSLHPDRRVMAADLDGLDTKPVDASAFVAQMKALLKPVGGVALTPPQPSAKSGAAPTAPPGVDLEAVQKEARVTGHVAGYKIGYAEGHRVALEMVEKHVASLKVAVATPGVEAPVRQAASVTVAGSVAATDVVVFKSASPRLSAKVTAPDVITMTQEGIKNAAARKLYAAVCRYADVGLTWAEVCIVAGMMPGNGYFYGGRKELIDETWVREEGGRIFPVEPDQEARHLTRAEFKTLWGSRKQPAPRMFDALCEAGDWVSLAELAKEVGLKAGNGFWYGGLSQLRSAGLIEQDKTRARVVELIRSARP